MNIRILLLTLVIFSAVVSAAPIPVAPGAVTQCYVQTNGSGTYYLTGDLDCGGTSFMYVFDSDVTIDLKGYRVYNGDTYGVKISNSNNVVVRNGEIADFQYGVYIDPSPNAIVEDLTLIGNWGDPSAGVYVDNSDNVIVRKCDITNYTYGVEAVNTVNNLLVTYNNFYDMYDGSGSAGIYLDQVHNSVISYNWFNNTGDGIFLMNTTYLDILDNEIYYTGYISSVRGWGDGIGPEGNVEHILIQRNTIDNCNYGYSIDLDDSLAPEMPANDITAIDNYFGYDCYTYLDVGENFTFRNIVSHDGWYIDYINYSTFEDISMSACDDYFDIEYSNYNTFDNINIWDISSSEGMYVYESYDNNFTDVTMYNVTDAYCLDIDTSDRNLFENTFLYECADDYLSISSTDPNNFTDLTLGYSKTRGLINWQGLLSLTNVGLIHNTNIFLSNDFVSLDPTNPSAAEMNDTARLTIEVLGCGGITYYGLGGLPTTWNDIVTTGVPFVPTYSQCAGTRAVFDVDGFSGYAANGTMLAPPSGGSKAEKKTLSVSHEVICPDNIVEITVTHKGNPAVGAEVDLAKRDPYSLVGTETTDSDGKVQFTLSNSGDYRATIDKDGYYYMNPYSFDFTICVEEEVPEEETEEEQPPAEEETPPEEEQPEEEAPPEEEQPPAEEGTTQEEAQAALDDAAAAIATAEAAGKGVSSAQAHYDAAQEAFDSGDYEGAVSHAEKATDAANAAAPLPTEQPPTEEVEEVTEEAEEGPPWGTVILVLIVIILIGAGAFWFLMQGKR